MWNGRRGRSMVVRRRHPLRMKAPGEKVPSRSSVRSLFRWCRSLAQSNNTLRSSWIRPRSTSRSLLRSADGCIRRDSIGTFGESWWFHGTSVVFRSGKDGRGRHFRKWVNFWTRCWCLELWTRTGSIRRFTMGGLSRTVS